LKIWAMIKRKNKIIKDYVYEIPGEPQVDSLECALVPICHEFDIECPVVLEKHVGDFLSFGRAFFKSADFIDHISFDMLEVEMLKEDKEYQ